MISIGPGGEQQRSQSIVASTIAEPDTVGDQVIMFVDDELPRLTQTDSQSVAVIVVELAHKANNKTIIRKANIE